ncbi:MAG TPA: branched-chain amino acid ABC transporter permease [bacterium]|nr:branched-chain amino acid ABC transporter permease [bacterium]
MNGILFVQQLINGLSLGAIYAVIALGYTMVYGIVELINFAHGDVYTAGSFVALALLTVLGATGHSLAAGVVFALILALVVTMFVMGTTGIVIERFAYRPLRGKPRLAPLLTAIGVSFSIENLLQLWYGPSPVPFPQLVPNPFFSIGPVSIGQMQLVVILSSLIMMVALHFFVQTTRLGRAMRATAQDWMAAEIMGIDINKTIALTFFVGSLLAGAAGVITGLYYGNVWFINGFRAGLIAFTAAVLGGIGNTTGAALGGFVIGFVEVMTAQYVGFQWAEVTIFSVLILVLVFRPTGILGQQLSERA